MQDEFVKKDLLTDKIEKAIKIEEKRRNSLKNHELFYSSQLTQCPRKILYQIYGEPHESDMLEEMNQKHIKKKWLDFFQESRIAKLIDTDIEAADTKHNVTSRVDGILRIGRLNFVVLIKSLINEEYQRAEKKALRRDVAHIMMDMWLTEVPHGLLLYENRETLEYTTFHILPYQPIIDAACKKCQEMKESKTQGKLPSRPYENSKNPECQTCSFNTECWNKE